METVKHHVDRSGNSSLRGFFNSDAVDFDPPSLSLRANITKAKAKVVYDLANGTTDDDDEIAIRDLIASSENSYEVIRLVDVMEGWSGLDDELEEYQVDDVARNLAQVLDQRDYVVYQLIRRYLILLDYDASPTLGDCFARLLRWPVEFQPPEFDLLLSRKADLLRGITSATLRGRPNMTNAARVDPNVIDRYLKAAPHRVSELAATMFEVNYTTKICSSLARLDYQPLYRVIADMVDPALSDPQRLACKETCLRLKLEFAAAMKSVDVVGSNQAKSTVNRFMQALEAAIQNFPAAVPAPAAVSAIAAVLNSAANTLGDLLTAVQDLPDALAGMITLDALLGADKDDHAVNLISALHAQGTLARASSDTKTTCLNVLLEYPTGDGDEIAVIKVLQAAKEYDQAELYQLAASATWDELYSSVDGDNYDAMESLLHQPV